MRAVPMNGPPEIRARRLDRARWASALGRLGADPAEPVWVLVQAAAGAGLRTVLPWGPVVALGYDPDRDRVEVATPAGVHHVDRPLVVYALGDVDEGHRLVVVGFDGRLTLIDVAPPAFVGAEARVGVRSRSTTPRGGGPPPAPPCRWRR